MAKINIEINILKVFRGNFSDLRALRLFFIGRKIKKCGFAEDRNFATISQKRETANGAIKRLKAGINK